ncbi:hypothetical protein R1sor_002761 [Riccia sorocarpa]|uniref:Reverse transcriptase zinc-binding domain-containing protein n=1 Tax=Riccia sorocarpa TaxID=122646 RepID=A0ABD3H5U0_9MARC
MKRLCLGWEQIKSFCRARVQQTEPAEKMNSLKKEIEERRYLLPFHSTEIEVEELQQLEKLLHTLEDQEAAMWVMRSRSKWLAEGEAPTNFFFRQNMLEESWRVITSASPVNHPIEELNCWTWNFSENIPGLKAVNIAYLLQVLQPKEVSYLVPSLLPQTDADKRWKALWTSNSSLRSKLDIWHLLHQGFFTNHKATTIGVAKGVCKVCTTKLDSIDHLF